MRFTILAALAACRSMATRPDVARASVSKAARLGDIMWTIQNGGDRLAALKAASSFLAESGGPDGHITPEDEELFREVIEIVNVTIYNSMDDAHQADVARCDAAIATAEACTATITFRQSAEGDLGVLEQQVTDKQIELDRLQGVVDDATEANNTAWNDFSLHMQQISPAPECPDFPARTMPALDVYFEESLYSIWFTAQQGAYNDVRAVFTAADSALIAANRAYNIQRAVRDVQYCDWRSELEAACLEYRRCFRDAETFFHNELTPDVKAEVAQRIEIKKAGDTLIHQINFLLGDVADQETPAIDTSPYELVFPEFPDKGVCDLSPLTSDQWVPTVVCTSHRLVDGCSRNGNLYPAWGVSRTATDDERYGEAVCCNENGIATRNIRSHVGLFDQGLSHADCTTTSGVQLKNGEDTPSHTFFEAQAICQNAGLRLCRTQEEMDTSCGTGCHINFALAWLDDEKAPYSPQTVDDAWLNHFEAFGGQDLDRIMLDYDDKSVLQAVNDGCLNGAAGVEVLTEHAGTAAIRAFFADLFETLTPTPDLVLPEFNAAYPNPNVQNGVGSGASQNLDAAHVFLVFTSRPQGINRGTDTFQWRYTDGAVRIEKQNLVVSQPSACPLTENFVNAAAPVPEEDSPVTQGWNNHFSTFGGQDREGILRDYTEESLVIVYSHGGGGLEPSYSRFRGLQAIGDMFDDLWSAMNAQVFMDSNGLRVAGGFPRVEVDIASVFLVWSSFSHPYATDTFLFDANGKITIQTILVVTGVAPMNPAD